MASLGGFAEAKHFLHRTIEPNDPTGLGLPGAPDPQSRSTDAAVGRSSGAAAMPLQLSQASSCAEVWTRSQNPGRAGRPDPKAADVPRCLRVRPELFVLGHDRLCFYFPRQFARSGRLSDFRGCLTTLDCGSTSHPVTRQRGCHRCPPLHEQLNQIPIQLGFHVMLLYQFFLIRQPLGHHPQRNTV